MSASSLSEFSTKLFELMSDVAQHPSFPETEVKLAQGNTIQQIRAEAVEFSVAIASKILQRNVSKEDNERLIEETFRQIQSTRPS